jgi:hypothetical protein
MANQIIFPSQTISVKDLVKSLNGSIKKIFFQCELVSVTNNDIMCRVVAYAAHRNVFQQWIIGRKVSAVIDPAGPVKSISLPLALGNCEWTKTNASIKRSGESNAEYKERKMQAEAIKKIHRMANDNATLKNASFSFKAGKSSNPHLDYTITLDSGDGSMYTSDAKPSPPAAPSA